MSVLVHAVHAAVLTAGAGAIGALLVGGGRAERRGEREIRRLREVDARGGPEALVAAALARAREGSADDGPTGPRRPAAVPVLIVATTVAAVVHGGVCPEHFHEGIRYGVFFLLLMTVQFGLAALAAAGHWRRVLVPTVAVNVATLGLRLLTRTVGLPFGLAEAEPVGLWDVVASVAEAVALGCAVAVLRAHPGPARSPVGRRRELVRG